MDLKGALEVLGTIVNAQSSKELIAARDAIIKAQSRELAANETIRKLNENVADRDEQLRKLRDVHAETSQYEEHEVNGTWVVIKEGQSKGPFYCPGCHSSGRQIALAKMTPAFSVIGTHTCPGCETTYTL